MPDVVPGVAVNESQPHVNHKHSRFNIEYNSFDTHQFGYVRPHFVVKGTPGSSFRHRPVINSRSYTLKAPLMQDVFRRLSYVKVNLDAVLPLNAEKIYTNPVIGDDVPVDTNTVVEGGFAKIAVATNALITSALTNYNANLDAASATLLFKALVFAELFYSRGSILASLGCHMYNQLEVAPTSADVSRPYDFDYLFDSVCSSFFNDISVLGGFTCSIDGVGYYVDSHYNPNSSIQYPGINPISEHDFINRIRETSDWSITVAFVPGDLNPIFTDLTLNFRVSDDVPFNYLRSCAYQLAVAEFMTNDKIDYIYSSELYRQNLGDFLRLTILAYHGASYWPQNFVYNGVVYQYDYLSGHYLDLMLDLVINQNLGMLSASYPERLQYFINLFGIKRSLRYKDYFVGSRSHPLAVGDVNVTVNSNLVNVVDVTRKIQIQRFLNVVNHAGRRLSNYVKTLFGVDISSDRHVPQFLAELTEMVYTSEVENTGNMQFTQNNSVTAIFTSNSSNKELEFGVDLESVIIGLTSYDIERAYINSIDRDFFIKDRFDMFLPELQFVGDQPIYKHELNASNTLPFGSAFGYQYRDMQWKQIYSRASGGFVSKLPGYSFLARPDILMNDHISSEFIRSYPAELDGLYLSLSGYSLGNYWHFIVLTKNIIEADLPMIANPTILE